MLLLLLLRGGSSGGGRHSGLLLLLCGGGTSRVMARGVARGVVARGLCRRSTCGVGRKCGVVRELLMMRMGRMLVREQVMRMRGRRGKGRQGPLRVSSEVRGSQELHFRGGPRRCKIWCLLEIAECNGWVRGGRLRGRRRLQRTAAERRGQHALETARAQNQTATVDDGL